MNDSHETREDASSPLPPPAGFTARPGTLDDLEEVTALFNRSDREIVGVDVHDPNNLRVKWTRPTCDLDLDSRVVLSPAGEIVGSCFTNSAAPHVTHLFFGGVSPDHRGHGIGCYLTRWVEARCQQRLALAPSGARVTMQTWAFTGFPPIEQLFTSRGMRVNRHFVKMGMSMSSPPELPVWPEGLELRPVDRAIHDRVICAADEDAFRDHWGSVEGPFEERYERWKHGFDTDTQTNERLWFVVWDGEQIAGFLIGTERCHDDPEMGYLMVMGVRPAWRRRGLAMALLRHGIRTFWDLGIRKAGLHADAENLTGAVRLYRRTGMEIVHALDSWELELRDGEELTVTGS